MDFAIVGMDCLLPGAAGAEEWIARSRAGEAAIREVPEGRWPMDPRSVLDPRDGAPDAATTLRGGFVDDVALEVEVPSLPLERMDPLFRLVLRVVGRALEGQPRRERGSLLLGNLSLPTTGAVRAQALAWREALDAAGAWHPWLEGGEPWDRWPSGLPATLAATATGLGHGGTALDAACASSLYAVRLGCDRLEAGLDDLVVAAGVNRADSSYLFLGFTQLRALSRSGEARPLDRRADGLLVGEGAAAVVLKRLPDALRDGDRIHAVIRGGGLGNDGRAGSMLSPSRRGQLRTLKAAWAGAGLDPATLGYVECHATGTPLGDRIEAETLGRLLEEAGATRPVVLGSAKGLIGHTVTAAGLAGLIRAVGAVRDGFLPPLPGCEPIAALGDRLRVAREPERWEGVRRAAVSAFGFGGTNAHLILDGPPEDGVDVAAPPEPVRRVPLAITAVSAHLGAAHGPRAVEAALRDGALQPASEAVTRGLGALPPGAYVEEVPLEPRAFRIAPVELVKIVPQHLLMLQVASEALDQVPDLDRSRTASIVGMSVDHHVSEQVLRWTVAPPHRDAIAPVLDAERVQGSLPNFVANRLASQLDLQGPSYTTSSEEASALHALAHAERLLASGAIDAAVVGAADCPGQVGAALARAQVEPGPVGEGAVALVVERLEDALASGRPVLAVVTAVEQGAGPAPDAPFGQAHRGAAGHCEAADGAVALLQAVAAIAGGSDAARVAVGSRGGGWVAVTLEAPPERRPLPEVPPLGGPIRVPHSGPPVRLERAAFRGAWGGDRVPVPLPRRGEALEVVRVEGEAEPAMVPLTWGRWIGLDRDRAPRGEASAARPADARTRPTPPQRAPTPPHRAARPAPRAEAKDGTAPRRGSAAVPATEGPAVDRAALDALGLGGLADALARSTAAMADAHALFLEDRERGNRRLLEIDRVVQRLIGVVETGGAAEVDLGALPSGGAAFDAAGGAASSGARPDGGSVGAGGSASRTSSGDVPPRGPAAANGASHSFPPGALPPNGPAAAKGAAKTTRPALPPNGPAAANGAAKTTRPAVAPSTLPAGRVAPSANGRAAPAGAASVPTAPPRFDRAALERFAAGRLSDALGPEYADLDVHEPRVRLPTPPLLLVSRVLTIEGQRGRLGRSRIVTEYDLPHDAWWAHDGKAPPCVVVESGQADLFLVSWLGIDAHCRGERVYRLLDCDLTFHGARPRAGETLRHDIRIDRFARLGDTVLFYFEYDCVAPADGRRVLTMRSGCAGFFTPAELRRPQGVHTDDLCGEGTGTLAPVVPGAPSTLDEQAILALSEGRFADALGHAFASADGSALTPPPSKWRLTHRVTDLGHTGGAYGLGGLRAEQDLSDDDWFNSCHFVGDPCMPGTLMLDGCMQALQLWLIAAGFPAEYPDATFEPLIDRPTRLRCRGQVAPGHRRLVYEVRVKEVGTDPAPYAVADVVLHCDGVPVVRAEDVGVRIEGRRVPLAAPSPTGPVRDEPRILEFSVGDPSRAFGPRFAPFDRGPRTPRMPGPPLLFLSRFLATDARQYVLEAGTFAEIAYDVPPDAWYFDASPQTSMPLAILLEVALQPCGWLTAWCGAALEADGEVFFRNLGGRATLAEAVGREVGTLVTRAELTSVSRSGGMILVFFDMTVRAGDRVVFHGETHFGYFTPASLAAQKGLRLPADEEARREEAKQAAAIRPRDLQGDPLLPRDDLRMIDRLVADDGRFLVAEKDVDPAEWFFFAHFHQDPVMPGSLGLEGLAQLARLALGADRVEPVAVGSPFSWRYRGQVTRERERLGYEVEVTERSDDAVTVTGVLRADGLPIYEITDLTVRRALPATPAPVPAAPSRPEPFAALLDRFEVDGDTGTGVLRLDPAVHPWLADHQPTLVVPAVPLAFAAEIAAEAARALRPGLQVVGLPEVIADKWVHTGEGPVDLLVAAVAEGDTVAVSLALHKHNARFPKLSGPVVHMRAVVRLGDGWAPAPPAPEALADGAPVGLTVRDYYDGGYTFHGPALQGMVDLGVRGPRGALSTFRTADDAAILPPGSPGFVLDPRTLDVATHPMMSCTPEIWVPGLASGKLAYPVRCDGLRFHGPRPEGEVRCRLDLVEGTPRHLVFDVRLEGEAGVWATFRWTEALVDGGPVLGREPDAIRFFAKERRPLPDVRVGRPTGRGWRVERDDLVEPISGTLVRLLCGEHEVREWERADDGVAWTTARLAAKEAVRRRLQERLGRDVHPASIRLVPMRTDRFVVAEVAGLTAQEQIDHLGATRADLCVASSERGAEAWFEER